MSIPNDTLLGLIIALVIMTLYHFTYALITIACMTNYEWCDKEISNRIIFEYTQKVLFLCLLPDLIGFALIVVYKVHNP